MSEGPVPARRNPLDDARDTSNQTALPQTYRSCHQPFDTRTPVLLKLAQEFYYLEAIAMTKNATLERRPFNDGVQLRLQLFRQPRCPDCGGPLVHGEGCATCPVCGYSVCG